MKQNISSVKIIHIIDAETIYQIPSSIPSVSNDLALHAPATFINWRIGIFSENPWWSISILVVDNDLWILVNIL